MAVISDCIRRTLEVVEDVTADLMFGARPASQGHHSTRLDAAAEATLKALSVRFMRSDEATEHLAGIADDLADTDGALHFESDRSGGK
ncbi:hypothetical protein [Streptomyces sp. NPDC094031]|uniref:hypothetical protein n=1 Tax=Streptomyces sp. NPDC094031 TaxID=3155307 RepID=UPI00332366B6